MNKPIVLIGSGGHASVLLDILKGQGQNIRYIVSPNVDCKRRVFEGIDVFNNDDDVFKLNKNEVILINGIGSMPGNTLREMIYHKFTNMGYQFGRVISDQALISTYATLSDDTQVIGSSIIHSGTAIGKNTIINTSSVIDHDCSIGDHNHIAPSATLSGGVKTRSNVHVGTGANIIQNISIGMDVVIGAGVTITNNIDNGSVVYPARNFIKKVGNEY